MKFEEVDTHLDRAWYEFFTYLSEQGFDAEKMEGLMDCKDCFGDILDCAMEAAPKGVDNDE